MDPSEEAINAQLEELVARVQQDQEELKRAAKVVAEEKLPPVPVPQEPPLTVAKVEDEPETRAVAPAENSGSGISNALLGKTQGEKLRTTAALAAGVAIGVASTSIIFYVALAGAGYGAYRFIRWRKSKNDPNREEIIDTTAEIRG